MIFAFVILFLQFNITNTNLILRTACRRGSPPCGTELSRRPPRILPSGNTDFTRSHRVGHATMPSKPVVLAVSQAVSQAAPPGWSALTWKFANMATLSECAGKEQAGPASLQAGRRRVVRTSAGVERTISPSNLHRLISISSALGHGTQSNTVKCN